MVWNQRIAHDWLRNYLENRQQFVHYKCKQSYNKDITFGVPQGSILGPLLFLIYINDLPNCLLNSRGVMFADDTNIYHRHANIDTLVTETNADLANLNEWFKANRLSLNASKTHYIYLVQKHKQYTQDL